VWKKLAISDSVGIPYELREEMNEIPQQVISRFQLIEQLKQETLSTDPDEKGTFIVRDFFEFLEKLLKSVIQKLKEWYNQFVELLPELFDLFIEGLMKYYKESKKQIPLLFGDIYRFFTLFGLREIQANTLNKLSVALQWKLIPSNWISLEFLHDYKSSLLKNTPKEILISLENLIKILKTRNREMEHYNNFIHDVEEIISD
jgi:hypothetical protein